MTISKYLSIAAIIFALTIPRGEAKETRLTRVAITTTREWNSRNNTSTKKPSRSLTSRSGQSEKRQGLREPRQHLSRDARTGPGSAIR